MLRASLELLVASLVIGGAFLVHELFVPAWQSPGAALPHAFGIVGLALMLLAEAGHSLRRLSAKPRLSGRTSLSVHVFAGLVGPALVLLHSGWLFEGLAGLVTLLILLVVASGIVGRFVFPVVGDAPEHALARRLLAAWHLLHVPLATTTIALAFVHLVGALYFSVGLR